MFGTVIAELVWAPFVITGPCLSWSWGCAEADATKASKDEVVVVEEEEEIGASNPNTWCELLATRFFGEKSPLRGDLGK